jgi:hypothetical protein
LAQYQKPYVDIKNGNVKQGQLDNIFQFFKNCIYGYIQDGVFLGQDSSKVYLFKLFTEGEGSGVDLVAHMQPRGGLQGTWLMFDHYKTFFGVDNYGMPCLQPNLC